MEELKYIIEDHTIAEILGVQNFSTKESAILELVKNSYDAGATKVNIIFEDNLITIEDNGHGMTENDIKNNWMHIGYSDKGYEFKDVKDQSRIFAGSKGIGRFALARLGANITVTSKSYKEKGILWSTDWNKNIFKFDDSIENIGTRIIIENLRDRWLEKSLDILKNFLSRAFNSDLMEIVIISKEKTRNVKKFFSEPKLGYNCLSYIDLVYSAQTQELRYAIYSDEFSDKANIYCKNENLQFKTDVVDMKLEIDVNSLKLNDIDINIDDLPNDLSKVGDFTARMFFSMGNIPSDDMNKFLYKYKSTEQRFDSGVILYRNAFSISSYEGKKDWIGFGKRARKSPAAASHKTGTWRVRENQISGYVNIDKNKNDQLKDMANRQGLEENIYYKLLVLILDKGIARFEKYRQNIIRKIDIKNSDKKNTTTPNIDKFVSSPTSFFNNNKNKADDLANEIKQERKENYENARKVRQTEEKYKYDVRILNMLSTIGLRASSIAHEMHNDRNNISTNYDYIVKAMKKYEIWDKVNEPENTKYSHRNIPLLLEKNKDIDLKILNFMDTMLENIERDQFLIKNLNIIEVLQAIKKEWEKEYSWVKIKISEIPLFFQTAEDIIKVILDNLILNSIQQNSNYNLLKISINIEKNYDGLFIKYNDNGKGLTQKYRKEPMRILEVHESSREDGHGLGMWIINNTLVMSGGKVIDIPIVDNGFEIQMILGDKL